VIAAVEDAARTDDIWVVVRTGSGDSFCAGLDLSSGERSSPLSTQSV
jgi:2-(1,2-epoxy-1,2-dihydrophenyl)acetyl-CoA isomerase